MMPRSRIERGQQEKVVARHADKKAICKGSAVHEIDFSHRKMGNPLHKGLCARGCKGNGPSTQLKTFT